jgi:hypothetical protein
LIGATSPEEVLHLVNAFEGAQAGEVRLPTTDGKESVERT